MEIRALTDEERDALGEVGNICMGNAAKTLNDLLGRSVYITTPRVSVSRGGDGTRDGAAPVVAVKVSYTGGVAGRNLMLLEAGDVPTLADIVIGGDLGLGDEAEYAEIRLSVLGEVMNQLMGAAATALSKVLRKTVNISTPVASLAVPDARSDCDEPVVIVEFDMEVDGLFNTRMLHVMPYAEGLELADALIAMNEAAIRQLEGLSPVAAPTVTMELDDLPSSFAGQTVSVGGPVNIVSGGRLIARGVLAPGASGDVELTLTEVLS
jgi:flagellar motor switch protein FliN/FliY